ncbi:hypothetical protein ALC62_01246, partial [Cyphomyrmex costatus]
GLTELHRRLLGSNQEGGIERRVSRVEGIQKTETASTSLDSSELRKELRRGDSFPPSMPLFHRLVSTPAYTFYSNIRKHKTEIHLYKRIRYNNCVPLANVGYDLYGGRESRASSDAPADSDDEDDDEIDVLGDETPSPTVTPTATPTPMPAPAPTPTPAAPTPTLTSTSTVSTPTSTRTGTLPSLSRRGTPPRILHTAIHPHPHSHSHPHPHTVGLHHQHGQHSAQRQHR